MASQIISDHALQTISNNTISGATTYVYNAVTAVNSVQQQTVQIDNNYYAGTGSTKFGLLARSNSSGTTFYALETSLFSKTANGSISIVKSIGGTVTTLATYNLTTLLSPAITIQFQDSLFSNNVYNMKFLVQTDAGNSNLTDLSAEIWQQGTAEPTTWQLTTTDSDTNLNGANDSGFGGIWEKASSGSGAGTLNVVNGYAESITGDPATITSFTASPTDYTGTYPVTATFNAAATYAHGTISSYTINFGDGTTPVTTSAVVNLTHSYTTAPSQAYTATLTVTDSTSGTIQAQQVISANTSVSTDPTGTLTMDRSGGNGISASNPLLVHFQTTGTPYTGTGYSLTSYILNFGDGTSLNMPIPSGGGTGTLSIDTNHLYTANGTITPTLTLVGNDGATTIVTDTTAPNPNLSISSTPPTVTVTYNTSTSILKAVFSEDVGTALVGQVDSNDNPLGEPLWTDGAVSAGSFANDLDIRNDNSGASVSLTGDTFSYNASNFTATWNLSTVGLNTSTTSYTARLFATTIQGDPGAGIQDQAGNDLDGIGSGIGGEDATAHFGQSYTTPTLTLATSGVWNTSMPLVFAPSIAPNDIQSLSTTNIGTVSSTTFTFTGNATNKKALDALIIGGFTGGPVIIEDMAAGYTALDGLWTVNAVTATNTTDTMTIIFNSTGLSDGSWVAGSSGSVHISPNAVTSVDNSSAYSIEAELISALKQITGATSIPFTGTAVSSGIFVGEAAQFDGSATDLVGFDKSFDNEKALGATGYIVNSNGNNLYLVGGGVAGGSLSSEQDAIDAFLQSLGMQEYGPSNTASTNPNVWQITPNFNNATGLTGSWDIRQLPGISYLNDNNDDGGNYSENYGWDTLFLFNYGGGSPSAAGGGSLAQQANLDIGATTTSLYANPDWWSAGTNVSLSGTSFAATFMPLGTISVGDTFSITLTSGATSQTVTTTANSTDDTPSGIAGALKTLIKNDVTDTFFESSSIVVTTNHPYHPNGPLTHSSPTNPVLEIYANTASSPPYKVSSSVTRSSGATFPTDVYHDSSAQLHLIRGCITTSLTTYVTPWVDFRGIGLHSSPSAPRMSVGYDHSQSTIDAMHSNNPFLLGDTGNDWQGYNQNGVLTDAVSESYWTLVNELAQYVLQNEGSKTLYLGGLAYASHLPAAILQRWSPMSSSSPHSCSRTPPTPSTSK